MLYKNVVFALFWLSSSLSLAQSIVLRELSPEHKSGIPKREAAFSFVDSSDQKLYLTYLSKDKMYLNVYQDFKKLKSLVMERTEDPGLWNQINAAILSPEKNQVSFLFSNPSCATHSIMQVNLLAQTVEQFEKKMDVKDNEVFLHAFSRMGKFYVLAIIKRSSILKLYGYDPKTGLSSETSYDFKDDITYLYASTTLWEIITFQNQGLSQENWYGKVRNANISSQFDPEMISRTLKFSISENSLIVLVDNYTKYTLMPQINLETQKASFMRVIKPKLKENPKFCQSNSFLFENMLIQAKVSSDTLVISLVSLPNKQVLAKFICSSEDKTIPFAASPISATTNVVTLLGTGDKESIRVNRLLKEAYSTNIFVGALRNREGKLEVYVGSYYQFGQTYPCGGRNIKATKLNDFSFLVNETTWQAEDGTGSKKSCRALYKMQSGVCCPEKAQVVVEMNDHLYFGFFNSIASPSNLANEETYYTMIEIDE